MKFSNSHKENLTIAKIGTIQSDKHLAARAIGMTGVNGNNG